MAEQAQITELMEKMAAEREKLLGSLEELSEEQASTPPKPDEWNQKQQMSHLCEMESAYRAWVERALEEDGANVDGVRGERPAIPLERANEHSLSDHLAAVLAPADLPAMVDHFEDNDRPLPGLRSVKGAVRESTRSQGQ